MADQGMPTSYSTQTTTQTSTSIGFHPEYVKSIPGILKVVEIVLDLLVFICAVVYKYWYNSGGAWVQFVSMAAFVLTGILFGLYLTAIWYRFPPVRTLVVLAICSLISACIVQWPHPHAQGFFLFQSAFGFIFTLAYFFLHSLRLFTFQGQQQPVVLSLIVFICACVVRWSGQGWVEFVAISAFISTLVYLIFHLLNLISRFPGPSLLIEFIYYIVFTVFFLIAAIVAAARGSDHSSVGAAAFFAFAATAVYAVDTFFQFRAWRSGQTEMTTTTTTMTTTSSSHNVEAARTTY